MRPDGGRCQPVMLECGSAIAGYFIGMGEIELRFGTLAACRHRVLIVAKAAAASPAAMRCPPLRVASAITRCHSHQAR